MILSTVFSGTHGEVITALLRMAVASINLYAVVALVMTLPVVSKDLRPHIWFVAVWSFITAVMMFTLALTEDSPLTISILNGAALFMVGGWATLVTRIAHRVRMAAALQEMMLKGADE